MMTEEQRWQYAEYLAEVALARFARFQQRRREVFGPELAKKLDDYTLSGAKYFHTGIQPKRGRSKKKQRLTRFQRRQKR